MFSLTMHAAAAETLSATELADKLATAIEDGDSVTRLRLKIKPVDGGDDQVMQLQIKARRSKGSAEVVYQMFWPKDRLGESFLIHQKGSSAPKGNAFIPTKALTTLGRAQMNDAVFGSDLSYQDVVENFFRWGTQELAGQETVERVNCVILDSKPGSVDATTYSRVRTWIDTRRMVALKVEKYDSSGKLARRITTTRVAKDDEGRYVPATLEIHRPGSATETEIEGSNVRHDVKFTDRDFTAEAIADFTIPR